MKPKPDLLLDLEFAKSELEIAASRRVPLDPMVVVILRDLVEHNIAYVRQVREAMTLDL